MRVNKYFNQNTLTELEAGCLFGAREVKMISRVKFDKKIFASKTKINTMVWGKFYLPIKNNAFIYIFCTISTMKSNIEY